jgi:hypothetical protein
MKLALFTIVANIVFLGACSAGAPATRADSTASLSPAKPSSYGDVQQRLAAQFSPLGQGPLRLDKAYRVNLPSSPFSNSAPAISPDGQRYFAYDTIRGLWFDSVEAQGEPKHLDGRLTIAGLGYAKTIPFAWASNSRDIFGAIQDTVVPNGFALSPLSTLLISVDGQSRKLPQLRHPAGNLDGILWVGGDGLAVAEFGTKGSYYRPEHDDKSPTIAMVDGRRGHILQAVPLPVSSSDRPATLVGEIDARVDARGRMYALFVLNGHRWFEWRQGEALHPLSLDTGEQPAKWFSVTPDLSKVLVMQGLSATGMICEQNPNCSPRTPVSGSIAELRDLTTGEIVWAIKGRATNFSSTLKPAISKDGRYALISMPAGEQGAETVALISMRDGKIIQQIGRQPTSQASIGFSEDGKGAWLSGLSFLITYHFNK